MITMSPGPKVGDQNFLDVGSEPFGVDRAVEQPWRLDAVVAKRGEEGHGFPAALMHLGHSRPPRVPHPLSGAMLVFAQVSSMKTRRAGSIRFCRSVHWARRRAMSGRSRSLSTTVFFEAKFFGGDDFQTVGSRP